MKGNHAIYTNQRFAFNICVSADQQMMEQMMMMIRKMLCTRDQKRQTETICLYLLLLGPIHTVRFVTAIIFLLTMCCIGIGDFVAVA